jgi:hypothetical protein
MKEKYVSLKRIYKETQEGNFDWQDVAKKELQLF